MFERQGEITPPCGEPSVVRCKRPSSTAPAFTHLTSIRRMTPSVTFRSRKARRCVCGIESKYLRISRSITQYRCRDQIACRRSRSAWWAERPGRKPYEQGRNSCSYTASSTIVTARCATLSSKDGTHQANCTISQPTFGNGRDRSPISPVARTAIRCPEGSEGLRCRDPEPASQRTRFYSGTAGVDRLGSPGIASLLG